MKLTFLTNCTSNLNIRCNNPPGYFKPCGPIIPNVTVVPLGMTPVL